MKLLLNTYPARVILCTSYEETTRLYASFGLEFTRKGAAFVEPLNCSNTGQFYVVGFANYQMALDNDILVHELIHLKNLISSNAGVINDPDNDEPEAYYYMYLFNTLSRAIRHDDELTEIYDGEHSVMNHIRAFEAHQRQQ